MTFPGQLFGREKQYVIFTGRVYIYKMAQQTNTSKKSFFFERWTIPLFPTGWFFYCSPQFSVPKWKTMGSQSEILNVQRILVGWTTFFFLALKFGRAPWPCTLAVAFTKDLQILYYDNKDPIQTDSGSGCLKSWRTLHVSSCLVRTSPEFCPVFTFSHELLFHRDDILLMWNICKKYFGISKILSMATLF